jgi:hypothetical protein
MDSQLFAFAKGSESSSGTSDTKPQPIDPVSWRNQSDLAVHVNMAWPSANISS